MNLAPAAASNHSKEPSGVSPAEVRALVKRAQTGDEAAFGDLVKLYYQRVYNVAYGLVNDPDEAQDLAQQAWLKVWKKIGTFQGKSEFFTWLYRLVTFVGLDHLRRKKRRAETALDEALEPNREAASRPPASRVSDPVRDLERQEIQARFNEAVQSLSPEQRTAIVLREIEGLSYEEIARAMKCRKGTVMSRIFYARKQLQHSLQDLR